MTSVKKVDGKIEIYCERCGEKMKSRHCKLACPNCGTLMDCGDY